MKSKIYPLLILLMFTVIIFGACSRAKNMNYNKESSAPQVVNIGTQPLPNDEKVAIAKGYFEKEMGVEVNIIEFQAGEIRNAMIAKSIDFAMLGSSSAILGIANGMDAQIIWIHEVLADAEQLVAKTGSQIDSPKDLVGKKVATPFSSTAHYSLLKALELEGIDEKDIILLDMQMPEVYAAWQRGDIDASYAWDPTLSELLKDGKKVISSKDLAERGVITSNVEIVRGDFAREYPDLVVKYIKAVDTAVNLYKEDSSEAAKAIAKVMEMTPEDAYNYTKGSKWLTAKEQLSLEYFGTKEERGNLFDSVMDTANFLYKQNELITEPSFSIFEDAINPGFIEEALKGKSN